MRRHDILNTSIKFIFCCTAIVISCWLAISAFDASKCVDLIPDGCQKGNIYASLKSIKDRTLAANIRRDSKALEFMVWEHERRQLSRKLIDLLRQRINLNPFNGKAWSQLIYLQKDADTSYQDRAWAIERAAKILNWNRIERSKLSHYCIAEYTEFQLVSPRLCSSLIGSLPKAWPDNLKAVNAGVPLGKFRAVLELEQEKLKFAKE